ncbi:MAG: ATP-binding protein [Lachnospiraceae bacterium]|nr:ATP-binding protein [Lachnospiraceae bacterium]
MAVINKNLKVDATMDNLDRVIGFVEAELELIECPMKTIMQITVSLEEVYVNVVNYAYDGEIGECEINLNISTDDGNILTLEIKDKGKYFNPLDKEDPDITLSADERGIGGLGIFMVKKSMDEVCYKNISGYNILTIVKKW